MIYIYHIYQQLLPYIGGYTLFWLFQIQLYQEFNGISVNFKQQIWWLNGVCNWAMKQHVCLFVCLFVCVFVCLCVCLCVCVFVCLCKLYYITRIKLLSLFKCHYMLINAERSWENHDGEWWKLNGVHNFGNPSNGYMWLEMKSIWLIELQ